MTLYRCLRFIIKWLYRLLNGFPQVEGQENVPKDRPVILASTHRSYLDIVLLVTEAPKDGLEIAFMAKKELFENKILSWIYRKCNAFPIDRENPSRASIKEASDRLINQNQYLGIFPSGSRFTTEIKGGTSMIQALAKVDIVPVVIQPPLTAGEFFGRKKSKIAFGEPIRYEADVKYNRNKMAEIDDLLKQRMDQLDQQLTPGYEYIPPMGEE